VREARGRRARTSGAVPRGARAPTVVRAATVCADVERPRRAPAFHGAAASPHVASLARGAPSSERTALAGSSTLRARSLGACAVASARVGVGTTQAPRKPAAPRRGPSPRAGTERGADGGGVAEGEEQREQRELRCTCALPTNTRPGDDDLSRHRTLASRQAAAAAATPLSARIDEAHELSVVDPLRKAQAHAAHSHKRPSSISSLTWWRSSQPTTREWSVTKSAEHSVISNR